MLVFPISKELVLFSKSFKVNYDVENTKVTSWSTLNLDPTASCSYLILRPTLNHVITARLFVLDPQANTQPRRYRLNPTANSKAIGTWKWPDLKFWYHKTVVIGWKDCGYIEILRTGFSVLFYGLFWFLMTSFGVIWSD